jgi:16S rRNA (cytosine967-C5)-methyltransferase
VCQWGTLLGPFASHFLFSIFDFGALVFSFHLVGVSRARAIAFDVLRRVEAENAYATDLLHAELGPQINSKDAALATELVLGVLRWRRLLDFLLTRQLKRPKRSGSEPGRPESDIERLDLPVAIALRMGLYQLRFLERIPASAAVNESVELVKRARKSSAASLVNAVLRRCAQKGTASGARSSGAKNPTTSHADASASRTTHAFPQAEDLLPREASLAERLAILHSHPTWIVKRWLTQFGEQRTLRLLEANNRVPRLTCALHDVTHREQILDDLAKGGLTIEPGALLQNTFAASGGTVTATAPFRRGAISIQDEASQLIPLLLGVRPGNRVLDLCAAPGGKTAPLVLAATPTGIVIAADRHAHRVRAMRKHFERLHLSRVHILELDAEKPLPFAAEFDRILADAPCSGTGTFARHPEIRWRLKPKQLAELHRLQFALLRSALEGLVPGGRIVYSTCSLEPEENEDVMAEVMRAEPGVHMVPTAEIATLLAPHLAQGVDVASLFDRSGYFRTFPGEQPTDGFFAAVLQKQAF